MPENATARGQLGIEDDQRSELENSPDEPPDEASADRVRGDNDPGHLGQYITFDHTVTREYDVLRTVHLSGSNGSTCIEVADALQMDKKVIETICRRVGSLDVSFPHLSNYTLFDTNERHHRLTVVRWYTTPGYIEYCKSHNLKPSLTASDYKIYAQAGGFRDMSQANLYADWDQYSVAISSIVEDSKRSFSTTAAPFKSKRKGGAVYDQNDNLVKGRPRKFVRVMDLAGNLLKRSKQTEIKLSDRVPDSLIYNKATKLLFEFPVGASPDDRPIPKPEDWDDPTGGTTGHTKAYYDALKAGKEPPVQGSKQTKPRGRPRKEKEDPASSGKKRKAAEAEDRETDVVAVDPIFSNNDAINEVPPKRQRVTRQRKPPSQNTVEVQTIEEQAGEPKAVESNETVQAGQLTMAGSQADNLVEPPSHVDDAGNTRPLEMTPMVPLESLPPVTIASDDVSMQAGAASSPISSTIGHVKKERTGIPSATTTRKPRVDHHYELQLREVLRFIEETGGITIGRNTMCSAIEAWSKTARFGGEFPPKVLNGRVDPKTAKKMTSSLLASGRIKLTQVASPGSYLGSRMIDVLWLPDIPEAQVDEFVRQLQSGGRITGPQALPVASEAGFSKTLGSRRTPASGLLISKEGLKALKTPPAELHEMTADDMRAIYQQDWRLFPQLYGWEPAVGRRLELLHEELLHLAQSKGQAVKGGWCISKYDIYQEIKLSTMCKVFPVVEFKQDLLDILDSPDAQNCTVREIDEGLRSCIAGSAPRMKDKVNKAFNSLASMGLLKARTKPQLILPGQEDSVDPDFAAATVEEGSHLVIMKSVPVVNWSMYRRKETPEEYAVPAMTETIHNVTDIRRFWYLTWAVTMSQDRDEPHLKSLIDQAQSRTLGPADDRGIDPDIKGFMTLASHLSDPAAWRKGFVLHEAQKRYLQWLVEQEEDLVALDRDKERHVEIAYRVFAPVEPTYAQLSVYVQHALKRRLKPAKQNQTKDNEEKLRVAIKKKLEDRQEKRQSNWETLVSKACAKTGVENSANLNEYLEAFHQRYLRNPETFNTTQFYHVVTNFVAGWESRQSSRSALIPSVVPAAKVARIRTHWTPQMEELARDAYVVIRHRKQSIPEDAINKGTLDAAWAKAFPGMMSYKIRRKVTDWMAENPANSEFMKRLAAEWEQIKLTLSPEELPDPDPTSLENFDLLLHISVLRQNVKKNTLYVLHTLISLKVHELTLP